MGNACMCVRGATVHVSNPEVYEARTERYFSSRKLLRNEYTTSGSSLTKRANSIIGEKNKVVPAPPPSSVESVPMSTPFNDNTNSSHTSTDNNNSSSNENLHKNKLHKQHAPRTELKPRFSMIKEGSSVSIVEKLAPFCSTFLLENIKEKIDAGVTSINSHSAYLRNGVILLIDISGFTKMCATLDKMADGAEHMTKYVNGYFTLLVDEVLSHGGDIDKWSGDAMLCIWYGDEPLTTLITRAVQCAAEVQNMYGQHKAGDFVLQVHCAIGAGLLVTFDLGGYDNEWLRYTHGTCLFELDTAVNAAKSGEVVISKNTFISNNLHDIVAASQTSSGDFLVQRVIHPVVKKQKETVHLSESFEPFLRSFVDKRIVQQKIDDCQERYISEIKYVTIVFISMINQKDYESEQKKMEGYSVSMKQVQQQVRELEGSIANFLRDEKAGVLVVTFGHPVSHTNDAYRAIKCASMIRQLLISQDIAPGVGISSGRSFFGKVGSDVRTDFTVMSDTANTAARLMKLSESMSGVILADEKTASRCEDSFEFEHMEPVTLKGKDGKLRVRKVTGEVAAPSFYYNTQGPKSDLDKASEVIFGRQREVSIIEKEFSDLEVQATKEKMIGPIKKSKAVVCVVRGPTGIGKSHLVTSFLAYGHKDLNVLYQAAKDTERTTLMHAFHVILQNVLFTRKFGNKQVAVPEALKEIGAMTSSERQELLISWLSEKEQLYASLLNSLYNVNFPETVQVRELDAKQKAEILATICINLYNKVSDVHEYDKTAVVFILEDYQYFDVHSKLFLEKLIYNMPYNRNSLFIITVGDSSDSKLEEDIEDLVGLADHVLDLQPFSINDAEQLAKKLTNCKYVDPKAMSLIFEKSLGNPQLLQAFLPYMLENGYLVILNDALHIRKVKSSEADLLKMPDSTRAMFQQKIDRLPSRENLIVKVASVLGKVFSLKSLMVIFPEDYSRETMAAYLSHLIEAKLLRIYEGRTLLSEMEEEPCVYEFVTALSEEICYSLLTGELRSLLHLKAATYFNELISSRPCDIDTETSFSDEMRRLCVQVAKHYKLGHAFTNQEELENHIIESLKTELRYIDYGLPYLERNQDYESTVSLLSRKLKVLEKIKQESDPSDWNSKKASTHFLLSQNLRVLNASSSEVMDEIKKAETHCPSDHELAFDITYEAFFNYYLGSDQEMVAQYTEKIYQLGLNSNDPIKKLVAMASSCMAHFSAGNFEKVNHCAKIAYDIYCTDPTFMHESTIARYQRVDLGVETCLFGQRSNMLMGNIRTSKKYGKRAEELLAEKEHSRTRQFFSLFCSYCPVLTRDFEELKYLLNQMPIYGDSLYFLAINKVYEDYMNLHGMLTDDSGTEANKMVKIKQVLETMDADVIALKNITEPNIIVEVVQVESMLLLIDRFGDQLTQEEMSKLFACTTELIDNSLKSSQKSLEAEIYRLRAQKLVQQKRFDHSNLVSDETIVENFEKAKQIACKQGAKLLELKIYTCWSKYDPSMLPMLSDLYYNGFDKEEVDYSLADLQDALQLLSPLHNHIN